MSYWQGISTQGKLESDLGDYFETQIPLNIFHLPTHIHTCMGLIFINTFVWATPEPVIVIPILAGYFYLYVRHWATTQGFLSVKFCASHYGWEEQNKYLLPFMSYGSEGKAQTKQITTRSLLSVGQTPSPQEVGPSHPVLTSHSFSPSPHPTPTLTHSSQL